MATIFNVNPNGTGFGTISEGADNGAHRENTIAVDTYFDNDVRLPGICRQTSTWKTDSTSGFSYSEIGGHVFLRGNFNGVSGSSNTTMATLGSNLAPSKAKYFLMYLKIGTSASSSWAWVRVKLDTTGKFILNGSTYIGGDGGSATPTSLYGVFDIEYWR